MTVWLQSKENLLKILNISFIVQELIFQTLLAQKQIIDFILFMSKPHFIGQHLFCFIKLISMFLQMDARLRICLGSDSSLYICFLKY